MLFLFTEDVSRERENVQWTSFIRIVSPYVGKCDYCTGPIVEPLSKAMISSEVMRFTKKIRADFQKGFELITSGLFGKISI